jgi:hypothetical protein
MEGRLPSLVGFWRSVCVLQTRMSGSVLALLSPRGDTWRGPAWSIHLLTGPLHVSVPGTGVYMGA